MEEVNEEVSLNSDQFLDELFQNDDDTSTTNELLNTLDASLNELIPKRKRGRPKKEEKRRMEPIVPRLNPDRNARHRKVEVSEIGKYL